MTEIYARNVAMSALDALKIRPRAEFRVFGRDIIAGVSERMRRCQTGPLKVREMPAETYVLSKKTTEANVKVRDGLLDIKTRVGVTPEGFEIFQPCGKFRFPVSRDELAEIFRHLKIEETLEKEAYPFDEFCALIRSNPMTALVTVEKKRFGFILNGAICEYAEVRFNGKTVETACCESENHDAMKEAADALGIAHMPNTNYLKAAREALSF